MIKFDSRTGYLPPGIHRMRLELFPRRFGWTARRRRLCGGLMSALSALASAGCRSVVIDGSFVTAKDEPKDWDAAFDPVGVDSTLLDPILLRHEDNRRAMNAKYLGDLFPWGKVASASGAIYLDFFQTDRAGMPKGVVELTLRTIQ